MPSCHRRARSEIAERLQDLRSDIHHALKRRTASPAGTSASRLEYSPGREGAILALVDHSRVIVERGEPAREDTPISILMQARLAGRSGASLEGLLRKCIGSQAILGEYLMAAARETGHSQGSLLQALVREQATLFEQLLQSVADEHRRGSQELHECAGRPYAGQLRRLLDGELADISVFPYSFEQYHIGLVAEGIDAKASIEELARTLNQQLLVSTRPGERVWAWLGAREILSWPALQSALKSGWNHRLSLGIGEPAKGVQGWRFSHFQAQNAVSVALLRGGSISRYADSALLASMLKDEVLADTLRDRYVVPLNSSPEFDRRARETLSAYLRAEQNTSSAAARLGVSRRTVTKRLRKVERAIGCSVVSAAKEIQAAMQFDDFVSQIGTVHR